MTTMSGYFNKLENYGDLEVAIIRATKINKVLKMIVKLSSIPRDEEFQFRRRAMDLLSKWKTVLDADTPAGASDEKDKDEKSKANGVSKEDSVDTPTKADTEGEKEDEPKSKQDTAEPQDESMVDADSTEKSQAPEPAKEESEKPASKDEAPSTDKTNEDKPTEEKPAEEKTEEKTAEAAA